MSIPHSNLFFVSIDVIFFALISMIWSLLYSLIKLKAIRITKQGMFALKFSWLAASPQLCGKRKTEDIHVHQHGRWEIVRKSDHWWEACTV